MHAITAAVLITTSLAEYATSEASRIICPVLSIGTTSNSIVLEATMPCRAARVIVTLLRAASGFAEMMAWTTSATELVSGAGVGVGLLEFSTKCIVYGVVRACRSVEFKSSLTCSNPSDGSSCP